MEMKIGNIGLQYFQRGYYRRMKLIEITDWSLLSKGHILENYFEGEEDLKWISIRRAGPILCLGWTSTILELDNRS